jgi:uncharacterized protein (TIGR02246 family)
MRAFRMLMCCAMFIGLFCSCEKKQATLESRAEEEQAIHNIEIAASEGIASKDLDKLVSLYADDGALYDERAPSIRGKDAIREAWRTTLAKPGLIIRINPQMVEISDSGDLGWGHGLVTMTVDGNDGKPVTEQWEYALVYMKSGGRWKIMADCIYSCIRNHLSHSPPKSRSPYAPLAPLIGLSCLVSDIWFLFGMPIVAIVYSWKFCRNRKLSTGFLVSTVMLIAFFVTAILLWRNIATHYWNLSFMTALKAAVDTARYGNPVEDTAESVLVTLMILSPLSAIAAGMIAGAARWAWTRHHHLAV